MQFLAQARGEAKALIEDFDFRFKWCIFTGLFTAYFSIFMPRALIPVSNINFIFKTKQLIKI